MQFKPISQTFTVSYDYQLYFTRNIFDPDNLMFRDIIATYKPDEPLKLLFVLDNGVHENHPYLAASIKAYCKVHKDNLLHLDTVIVKGGETVKNKNNSVPKLLEAIDQKGVCRHSFVVVIGGGAVIDMAGYAASIAHRGVKLIRIPTTVLSQNDAAVGVKNGVNLFNKKNFVGTFATPFAIINDSEFLTTLKQRDWISGVAEAVKVALIKDTAFFRYLSDHAIKLRKRDMDSMQYVIYRCAELHMQHIAKGGDPFESGSSRPLDFGHWAAHKLEQMTNHKLRHGEAVAKGIALDLTYACLMEFIDDATLDKALNVLQDLGFDLFIPIKNKSETDELLRGLEEFREHLGGQLTITLISGIGKKYDVHEIDLKVMRKALQLLNRRSKLNVA
ncbi:MAG: 3-dehydroquinate synthase [Bacteroidota bacterium]